MTIDKNHVVGILYEVREKDADTIVDSNLESGFPLEFVVGSGQIITGLENAIIGRRAGEKININIEPMHAYGEYKDEFVQEVPLDQFEGITLERGMTLFGRAEDGRTVQVTLKDMNNTHAIIDYNHPLAGKTLEFNVEIISARIATDEEIMRGSVGGGCGCSSGGHDGHDHGEGGCCGGGGGGCGCSH